MSGSEQPPALGNFPEGLAFITLFDPRLDQVGGLISLILFDQFRTS